MPGMKEQFIRMIEALPDDATVDDLMSELYFKTQVDAGIKELDEGLGIPHQMVEERLSKHKNSDA